MMLDVDRFKNVNDTLGHAAGDELIRQLGARLVGSLARGTLCARLGGDEFAIMLSDVAGTADAEKVAGRMLLEMEHPFVLEGQQVVCSVSIGIAVSDEGDKTGSDLLRKADIALYEAKSKGRRRHQVFFHELNDIVLRKRAVEQDLRTALEDGTLTAAYQPVFNSTGSRVVGAEALVRWQHPVHGTLPPAVLIAIAEERGLIEAIGRRVLQLACHLLKETSIPWIAVNVSPAQLRSEQFATDVASELQRVNVSADRLQIEIKEPALMEDETGAAATLSQLRALGIKVVLDNFGTGYSSLNYLRQYRVDKVKIDRSLVTQMTASSEGTTVVQAIISLARSLKKGIAAEGVESEDEKAFLMEFGCDEIQGFWLSKPLTAIQLRSRFELGSRPLGTHKTLAGS